MDARWGIFEKSELLPNVDVCRRGLFARRRAGAADERVEVTTGDGEATISFDPPLRNGEAKFFITK